MENSLSMNMGRRIKGTRKKKKKSELERTRRTEWGQKFETAEATEFTHAQILMAKGITTII